MVPSEQFSIRTVSALTGLSTVTLRAWERRYGLLRPLRSPSGHRLYTHAHVEAVRRVLAPVERGIPVSRVRQVLDAEAASRARAAWVAPGRVTWSGWRPTSPSWMNRGSTTSTTNCRRCIPSSESPATLGADTPLAEVGLALRRSGSDGVAISSSVDPHEGVLDRDLAELVSSIPAPVFVGGKTSVRHRGTIATAGAIPLGTNLGDGVCLVAATRP